MAENPACGDVLHLWVAAGASGVRLAFKARACSAVIATASLVCETLEGASLAAVRGLDVEELVRAAGGVPPGKGHAPKVVRRALDQALAGWDRARR